MNTWFEVDQEGLAKLLAQRGAAFALHELVQNAWDTEAKNVLVTITPFPSSPYVRVSVTDDDPEGFNNLAHAFTLFGDSEKKHDPTRRGRFCLGEKLVIALCRTVNITSTKGTVYFDDHGRHTSKICRTKGTAFVGEMRMTRDEMNAAIDSMRKLIPPPGVTTLVNGEALRSSEPDLSFACDLPTVIADHEGFLKTSVRNTFVTIHPRVLEEPAKLYEMGIPVVDLDGGENWHVNVHQKVPLNMDRDNVPPAFLRKLRVHLLNHAAQLIDRGDATKDWTREASSHPHVSKDALDLVMTLRFGQKRVAFDPSDPEGSKIATSQGYTVVSGGSLSADEWANVRKHGLLPPAGDVTPSPKVYSPDGREEKVVPEAEWSAGMKKISTFAKKIAHRLLDGLDIEVRIVAEPHVGWGANFGDSGSLTLNVGRLGGSWFNAPVTSQVLRLLIHEFGHYYSLDHLSAEYHQALCKLGAKLAMAVAEDGPDLVYIG